MAEITIPAGITTTTVQPKNSVEQGKVVPGGALGKDEFLQLLMTQMRNQDPLNPTDSTASIAQLAQFSALEQMSNVSSEVAGLRRQDAMLQSLLLQGKSVTGTTEADAVVQGLIDQVTWDDTDGMVLSINQLQYPMNKFKNLSLYDAALSSGVTADVVQTPVTGTTTVPVI